MASNKMQGHFWHQFLNQISMLFHVVAFILVSMAAKITAYFKDSDWLLKNFDQWENGWKSYHGEQNRGYHVKEHKKVVQKHVSKVTLHFVWGHLSRKQTVFCKHEKYWPFWPTFPWFLSCLLCTIILVGVDLGDVRKLRLHIFEIFDPLTPLIVNFKSK